MIFSQTQALFYDSFDLSIKSPGALLEEAVNKDRIDRSDVVFSVLRPSIYATGPPQHYKETSIRMSTLRRTPPTPSIQRLPSYLRVLRAAKARGELFASCTKIADELGQQSVQVRKDLAITGVMGRPKVGYQIDELIGAIESFLGWDQKTTAFLFGVGKLGTAILNYSGFAADGLEIVEVFDANPKLIGRVVNGRTIRDPKDAAALARAFRKEHGRNVDMGIVTVPGPAAQDVARILIEAEIHAIWNYAPATLELPADTLCENVKLSESFAVLTRRMKARDGDARNSRCFR